MLDKHTFVIAAHGESEFLEDCIKSIFRQTKYSTIIMATATDNTHIRNLAEKYNIPLHVNPNGGSIGKDWNYCLSLTETPYVTIAHQDDIYLPHYTEDIVTALEKDPKAAIAFTEYHEIRNGLVVPDNINLRIKKLLLEPFKRVNTRTTQKISILFGSAICCPSVTYNKDLILDYSFDETLKSDLDWKAWVDFYNLGYNFVYIPKVLMLHRIHGGSETSKVIENQERHEEDLQIFKMMWPDFAAKGLEQVYRLSEFANNLTKKD